MVHTEEVPLCETNYFRRLDLLCHTCGKALRGRYITALGRTFHTEHFTCQQSGCGTVFGADGYYFEYEGKPFCEQHYSTCYARTCHGCSTWIIRQTIKNNGEAWHPECCESSVSSASIFAYLVLVVLFKLWNFELKNEFARSIVGRKVPQLLGTEVSYERLAASVTSTKELVNEMWSTLSSFEESCATALSGMLLHATKPDPWRLCRHLATSW
jgi:hypothetical protein